MKKLSLKECKKRCAELWDWLADNPGNTKNKWPEWEYNGGKYSMVINRCFACEYTLPKPKYIDDFDKINCKKCFLLGLWFNDKIPKNIDFDNYTPCEEARNSPYKLYKNFGVQNVMMNLENTKNAEKECSYYARKIADYCKKH